MPSSLEVWIPWGWLVWLLKTEAKKALRTSVLSSVVLLPTAANKGRKFSSALLLQLMCLWKHFFIFRSSGQIKFLFGFLLSDFLSVSKQHHSIPLELPDPSLKDDKLLWFFFLFLFSSEAQWKCSVQPGWLSSLPAHLMAHRDSLFLCLKDFLPQWYSAFLYPFSLQDWLPRNSLS